jgi:AAA+ ATPase superfamily predicted ATPase
VFDVTQNPFVYGEVVPALAFVDRVAELDRLARDLAAGQKVFLISPRRYGKSSLIRDVMGRLAALVRQAIVMKDQGRYLVYDSLYREWMARRTF